MAWAQFMDDLGYGNLVPTTTAVFITEQEAAAASLFAQEIAGPVLEARCLACHIEGGLSGHTRLVFDHEPSDAKQGNNIEAFTNFFSSVEEGDDYLLTKVRGGNGHGLLRTYLLQGRLGNFDLRVKIHNLL